MNEQHIQHLRQLQECKNEITRLKEEVEFMNKIFEHGGSLVFQMKVAKKNGKPVWIDSHKITIDELLELDKDDYINKLILDKQTSKYSER